MAVRSGPIPKHYGDILKLLKQEQNSWMIAIHEEMKSLSDCNVWRLVDLLKGKPVEGRWVFAVKSDSRKKVQFVAKGFTQVFRIDYKETFSSVARFETFQLLIALAVLHDWELEALDVKTAFLFGELDEEIYLEQPEGFVV